MYRGINMNSKGEKCYCPVCCQFGSPAKGVAVEGKTKKGVPIKLCTRCGSVEKKKTHKDLPGQKYLDFSQ